MIFALVLLAHSWYPQDCCEDGHCHPVPCSEIRHGKDNLWHWEGYSFKIPRPSEDNLCHVCIVAGNGICLFLGGTS